MMFVVRSAFWLSLVYAHMPFDDGAVVRTADEAKGAIVTSAAAAAEAKCAPEAVSCRAILSAAAGAALSPDLARSRHKRPRARGAASVKNARISADSLNAADLATPWRGRMAKSGP